MGTPPPRVLIPEPDLELLILTTVPLATPNFLLSRLPVKSQKYLGDSISYSGTVPAGALDWLPNLEKSLHFDCDVFEVVKCWLDAMVEHGQRIVACGL